MQTHNKINGQVVPLDIANVDTDAIIPKQFLQKITRDGFGKHLFHDWRFLDADGRQPNPNFVLNQSRYQKASILLTRANFGCGSSREHAAWALADFGFKAIIAPSFADIFYANAINNQIIPITLPNADIDALFDLVNQANNPEISIDLAQLTLSTHQQSYRFLFNDIDKQRLLYGLDQIDLTLTEQHKISEFETKIPVYLR